ncbi:unnamed protein product [Caenorhabditis auriculariae]|uniref:SXP/RAL-2 family protein Ani s 5-like cation-binding domain-containing protein n=1 Tax=Caenorhabditis auriculariae TaxID=2777116 RepID=A0A8S1I0E5_9PELO|nr:unnamed protein product [Caenorhabditis auriculariae]
MFNTSRLVVLLSVASLAFAQDAFDQTSRQLLMDSGFSENAVVSIIMIAAQHENALKALQTNPANDVKGINSLKDDVNKFLLTASEYDQEAWKVFEAKMIRKYVDGYKKAMRGAGVSRSAIEDIIKIGEQHEVELKAASNDPEALEASLEALKADIEAYIATASSADQAAWKGYQQNIQAKKALN